MKTVGMLTILAVVVGLAGFMSGWFNPEIELNVDPEVTSQVKSFTKDTIQSAQEHGNTALEDIKNRLQEDKN